MRIGLDATPLTVATGGIRRYTVELTRALADAFPEDDIWLFSDQQFDNPAAEFSNVHCAPGPATWLERRWWLYGLPSQLPRRGVEVFHGTDFAVPYVRRRPAIMTVHDLSPWLEPEWHAAAERIRRRTPLLLRLGLAAIVITPSEAVRREVIERFG